MGKLKISSFVKRDFGDGLIFPFLIKFFTIMKQYINKKGKMSPSLKSLIKVNIEKRKERDKIERKE